jgi:hypothetical protein
MIAVKDNPNLIRDGHSKGIINVDYAGLQEHRNKRKITEEISTINNEITNLKNDINEIKHLLLAIINK